jgi:RNA polymerase sigma factor (sigma-70 family)
MTRPPAGGAEGGDEFCRRLHLRLLRVLRRFVGPEEAEDLAQSAYEPYLLWTQTHERPRNAFGWLLRVALRQRGRRLQELPLERVDERLVAFDESEEIEMRVLFEQALARLSPDQRLLLEWLLVDDLEPSVIAARLGVSQNAARLRLRRAIEALRRAALELGFELDT